MAVVSKEALMETLKSKFGDDNSDEVLGLFENIEDTFNDYDQRLADTTDWKSKYEQNDAEWRTKYRERFFTGSDEHDDDPEPEPKKKLTFESLFS